MASIDTRSMDGRIYVGDHKTDIYKLWVSPYQRERFLIVPIILLIGLGKSRKANVCGNF